MEVQQPQSPSPPPPTLLMPEASSAAWSPAIASSWHTQLAASMTYWSPCTSGGERGADMEPQALLTPISLAQLFAMASEAPESPDPMCFWEVGSTNLSDFEVPLTDVPSDQPQSCPSARPQDDVPPLWWARSCVELPGVTRGWVPLSSPTHSHAFYHAV